MNLRAPAHARRPVAAAPAMAEGAPPVLRLDPARRARHGLLLAAAVVVAVCAVHHATFWSMMSLWSRSQTFAHGFAVLPISVWLIWRRRAELAACRQRPAGAGLLSLAALGLVWLVAAAAGVPVLMQYSVMLMLPAGVLAVLGWPCARAIAFPLAYLLLAVPFGEVLMPPLMEFTARFTVGALQLSGVPVFRENNFFSIPSGDWSVVEACSGLRYLIASLALGALYAHLHFHSTGRRLAFLAAALLLPVLGNGVRAYLIVMLGHWSGMRLAVGVDHLIYGWVFFGLISLLLFWGAAHWRDIGAPAKGSHTAPPAPPSPDTAVHGGRQTLAALACVALAAGAPLLAARLLAPAPDRPTVALTLAPPPSGWRATSPDPDTWRLPRAGAPSVWARAYRDASRTVNLELIWYRHQSRNAELLTQLEKVPDALWRQIDDAARTVRLDGRTLAVRQSVLQGKSGRVLVWRWYRQSGVDTANAFRVKFLLARGKLLGDSDCGAEITVTAPFDQRQATAEAALRDFLTAMLPAIDRSLSDAARR